MSWCSSHSDSEIGAKVKSTTDLRSVREHFALRYVELHAFLSSPCFDGTEFAFLTVVHEDQVLDIVDECLEQDNRKRGALWETETSRLSKD
jgi:hypothetical protein